MQVSVPVDNPLQHYNSVDAKQNNMFIGYFPTGIDPDATGHGVHVALVAKFHYW